MDFKFESAYKMYLIKWLDSAGCDGTIWESKKNIEEKDNKPIYCISIGFLFADTPDAVTLISTDSEHCVLGRLTIPQCAIQGIWELDTKKIGIPKRTIKEPAKPGTIPRAAVEEAIEQLWIKHNSRTP